MIDPGFTSDYITLEVIVNHTHPGFAGVNNNFIATRVKEGIFLSWGNFGFGETGFNLYKRDDSGSFMKLNESPYKAMETYTDTDVVDGITYQYKLGLVMEDGNELTLGPLSMGKKALPTSYSLLGNRPNPMNGETEIRFAIPSDSRVSLKVYDVKGSLVKTIVDETIEAGYHSAIWNGMSESGQSVSNGIYFYRLTAGDFKESRKMVVLR